MSKMSELDLDRRYGKSEPSTDVEAVTVTATMLVDILDAYGNVRCSNCALKVDRYASNGNIAIQAVCTGSSRTGSGNDDGVFDGEPWGCLTINIQRRLVDGLLCVKDYSEGSGNLRTLVTAGIVEAVPVEFIASGFVQIPVCRLTDKGKKFVKEALNDGKQ